MRKFRLLIISLFLFTSSNVFALGINDGLVGWWKLDEGGGTATVDNSGNGNTGTLTNGPTWVGGKRGSAVNFDGSNDYISTTYTNAFSNLNFTISLWFTTSTTQGSAMFSKRRSAGGWPQITVEMTSNASTLAAGTKVGFYESDGTNVRTAVSANTFADGKWHNLVLVRDSSSTRLYVDNVLEATDSSTLPTITTTDQLYLGALADQNSVVGYYFTGSMDDIRIYNRALSATEIAMLANNRNQIRNAGINNGQVK